MRLICCFCILQFFIAALVTGIGIALNLTLEIYQQGTDADAKGGFFILCAVFTIWFELSVFRQLWIRIWDTMIFGMKHTYDSFLIMNSNDFFQFIIKNRSN